MQNNLSLLFCGKIILRIHLCSATGRAWLGKSSRAQSRQSVPSFSARPPMKMSWAASSSSLILVGHRFEIWLMGLCKIPPYFLIVQHKEEQQSVKASNPFPRPPRTEYAWCDAVINQRALRRLPCNYDKRKVDAAARWSLKSSSRSVWLAKVGIVL